MATHSSVLAWRIPGMGEPGGLLSVGSRRVRHDWSDLAAAAAVQLKILCIQPSEIQNPPLLEVSFSSVQFNHSVMSNYLPPHEPQHTRPPCPSPIPGVHPNSRRLSPWCHPATSSSVVPFSSCPQTLPASNFTQVFSNESALHIRWQKYWSFSFNIRPSSEHTKTDVL